MIRLNNHNDLLTATRLATLILFAALILYLGKTLFVPLCYALLIAIVLYPICRKLERRGWPRGLAITLGLTIVLLLFAALLTLLVLEIAALRKDLPELQSRLQPLLDQLQAWTGSASIQGDETGPNGWQKVFSYLAEHASSWLQGTANVIFMLFLVPVFSALLLYNRDQFLQVLERISGPVNRERLHTILHRTVHTYFHFIRGMIAVYLVVGLLNSIGLLALGIRHAILFGFLTAIMTIIPYIGIFVSALLPISVAWIDHDSIWYPLAVIALFAFVQYLEANVIFPRIVAAQLKVSTFATLIAILAGGILWGVSGMILFIPFVGILKIMSEQIPEWKTLHGLLDRDYRTIKTS